MVMEPFFYHNNEFNCGMFSPKIKMVLLQQQQAIT